MTKTRSSAIAEGPREALVSRNPATTKTSHMKTLSCGTLCEILRLAVLIQYQNVTHRHTQTDGQTQDDGIYHTKHSVAR